MAPIVDGIEQKYKELLVVKRINASVGDGPQIMRDYHIPGHPTLLIFNAARQEVTRMTGPQSQATVEQALQPLVNQKSE